jgi:hypothetical protein
MQVLSRRFSRKLAASQRRSSPKPRPRQTLRERRIAAGAVARAGSCPKMPTDRVGHVRRNRNGKSVGEYDADHGATVPPATIGICSLISGAGQGVMTGCDEPIHVSIAELAAVLFGPGALTVGEVLRNAFARVASVSVIGSLFLFVGSASGMEDEDLVEFCISGMQSFRDQLQSGVYVSRGRAFSRERGSGTQREHAVPVEIHCEFEGDRLRFQRTEGDFSGTFLRSDGHIATYIDREGAVVKDAPESESARVLRPFDIRSMGLLSFPELDEGFSVKELFELLHDRERSVVAGVEEEAGKYAISWIIEAPPSIEIKRTLWIDSEHGFTPFRMEVRVRDKSQDLSWDEIPANAEVVATWGHHDGVWVPTSCQMNDAHGTIGLTMEFDWKSINAEIPETRFMPESLDVPNGTYFVDGSLDVPVVEEVKGRETLQGTGEARAIDWRVFLVCITLVAVIVILALLIRRRALAK